LMWIEMKSFTEQHTAQLLLVDDEPNIRQPLARALSLKGYDVQEAGAGYEALTLLQHTPFDLMVLDMHMPDLDGVEVMREARRLHPNLLILVLTGHPSVDNAVAAVRSDVADFLCKPATVHEIACTVGRILQKNAQRLQRERVFEAMTQMMDALHQAEHPAPTPEPEPEAEADLLPDHLLIVPPLVLDRQLLQVTVEGVHPVQAELTKGETAVLAAFMSRPNNVITCRDLVGLAWGYDADEIEAESVIRPYIFRLRRKLEPGADKPKLIRTLRNRGYMLNTEP